MGSRSYSFTIHGMLPPKKGMDLSMFGKSGEAKKVAALRLAAYEAMQGDPPLVKDIRLTLVVHIGRINDRTTGDLDNFITGVCDALMAAVSNAKIASIFEKPELAAIHPLRPIAILDDSQILEINALKAIDDAQAPWYKVTITGE